MIVYTGTIGAVYDGTEVSHHKKLSDCREFFKKEKEHSGYYAHVFKGKHISIADMEPDYVFE
jgi:hypothetical protein